MIKKKVNLSKIFLFILIIILSISFVSSYSSISGCTETATNITCSDGTFTGNYIDTTKNIFILRANLEGRPASWSGGDSLIRLNSTQGNITIDSAVFYAQGKAGDADNRAGRNAEINIFSNSYIKIQNTTLNSPSGGGYSGSSGNPPTSGTPSGDSKFYIISSDVLINSSTIDTSSANGGNGGNGNAPSSHVSGAGSGQSGKVNLTIYSSILNIINSNISGYSGNAGRGGDGYSGDGYVANGGSCNKSGDVFIDLEAINFINISNSYLNTSSGTGGREGVGDRGIYTMQCGDSAIICKSGNTQFNLISDKILLDSNTFNTYTGNGGNVCYGSYVAELARGGNGGTSFFNIKSNSFITYNNLRIDNHGGRGGSSNTAYSNQPIVGGDGGFANFILNSSFISIKNISLNNRGGDSGELTGNPHGTSPKCTYMVNQSQTNLTIIGNSVTIGNNSILNNTAGDCTYFHYNNGNAFSLFSIGKTLTFERSLSIESYALGSANATNIINFTGNSGLMLGLFNVSIPSFTTVYNNLATLYVATFNFLQPQNLSFSNTYINITETQYYQNPQIQIIYPTNNQYFNSANIGINYTISDYNLDSCWWSNNSGIVNTSITCGNNISYTGSEGTNTILVYTNDSFGSSNSSSTTFTIDLTNPSIDFTGQTPTNGLNTSSNSFTINITGTDVNRNSAWVTLNNINYTMICSGTSPYYCYQSFVSAPDGTYTFYSGINDLAGNQNISTTRSFIVDTANPASSLLSPLNASYLNVAFVNLTANNSDSLTGIINQTIYVFNSTALVNQTFYPNPVSIIYLYLTNLKDDIYKWFSEVFDFANNKYTTQNNTFIIDTTLPVPQLILPTPSNGFNQTASSFIINISLTEINEANNTFNLYNTTGLVNSTTLSAGTRSINFSGLISNKYFFNITSFDLAGNQNSTETRQLIIDSILPIISIISPSNQNYANNNSIDLNFSVSDSLTYISSCWYNVQNASGYFAIQNTTIPNCNNLTFGLPSGDINYNLTFYSNDSLNNVNFLVVTFGIRTNKPSIVLNYPTNNLYLNFVNNLYINFTVTSPSAQTIDTCTLYEDFNGTWMSNYSWINPNSGIMNFTILNVQEKINKYNVLCNTTNGNSDFALNNFTFTNDITPPYVKIDSLSTTAGSQTFIFNITSTDTNLDICKYSIYNLSGTVDGLSNNITFSCNSNPHTATTTSYGNYNFIVTSFDLAGNQFADNVTFTTSASSGGTVSGAGGGGGAVKTLVSATNFTLTTTSYGNLLDIALSKDSVKPSKADMILKNKGIEPIKIILRCDTSLLEVNKKTPEGSKINICNYVSFSNKTFIASPNELNPTQITLFVQSPFNSSYGDVYNFNIIAEGEEGSEIQYSKLSVSSRVTYYGAFYKWSYFPLQSIEDSDKKSYPVILAGIVIGFSSFLLFFLSFRRVLPSTSFVFGLISGFAVLFLLVFLL